MWRRNKYIRILGIAFLALLLVASGITLHLDQRVKSEFEGRTVKSLREEGGGELPLVRLEPLPIGGIYPANNEDRVLVRISDVPPDLVKALIATEDRTFYTHKGFSPRSVARALLSLGSDRVQGGSTITQQLVKNFFLTPERTV